MFVIVYSYIYISTFLLVVLKYGAGKLEKTMKSNEGEFSKYLL